MKDKIVFAAYMMPPQANWNAFRDKEQQNPNFITDEHYKRLVEAGFTHGIGLYEHGADVALSALSLAQRHGLQYYVRDEINWMSILDPDFYCWNAENYERYLKFSSFAGLFISDEPNAAKFAALGKMADGYRKFFGDRGEPFINLLPVYANHIEQFGTETYEEYLRAYVRNVNTSYIMYDHYPFMPSDNDASDMRDDYLYNADTVARICKESGREMRTFVQSVKVNNYALDITPETVGLQIHTCLSYGSRFIAYFHYWASMESENAGVVNAEGVPGTLYEGVKRIHANVKTYERLLTQCNWEKTLYVKGKKEHGNKSAFSYFACEDESSAFTADYDMIVGVFDYKGAKAYYAVNYTHPKSGLNNPYSFRLNGKYEVYSGGEKREVADVAEGILGCGDGAFIVPTQK